MKLTAADLAVMRARVNEPIGTPELPTPLEDRAFDAPTITLVEELDAQRDPRIPDRRPEPGNTTEARRILGGVTRQSLYAMDLPYKVADGHRHYDLAAVRRHAAKTRLPDGYVRLDEAAEIVGVEPQTLARWTREGKLPAVEINGSRAYKIADLPRRAR
jgi:excisionase family DNA binding protein